MSTWPNSFLAEDREGASVEKKVTIRQKSIRMQGQTLISTAYCRKRTIIILYYSNRNDEIVGARFEAYLGSRGVVRL